MALSQTDKTDAKRLFTGIIQQEIAKIEKTNKDDVARCKAEALAETLEHYGLTEKYTEFLEVEEQQDRINARFKKLASEIREFLPQSNSYSSRSGTSYVRNVLENSDFANVTLAAKYAATPSVSRIGDLRAEIQNVEMNILLATSPKQLADLSVAISKAISRPIVGVEVDALAIGATNLE